MRERIHMVHEWIHTLHGMDTHATRTGRISLSIAGQKLVTSNNEHLEIRIWAGFVEKTMTSTIKQWGQTKAGRYRTYIVLPGHVAVR